MKSHCRRQPEELSRLVLWLNRELKVLLNAEHRVLYALNVIRDALTRYDILSAEFRNIVHPFVNIHTDHFLHELYNFAKSNFDLVGYDESVMYFPNGSYLSELCINFIFHLFHFNCKCATDVR